MSVPDKEISTVEDCVGAGGGNGGDDGDGDDDDESGGVQGRDEQKPKKRAKWHGCYGFSMNFGKARHLVLGPFTKAQRKRSRKTHIKASSNSSALVAAPNASSSSSSGKGCCLCIKKSGIGESSFGSPTSDPNDPTFTYDVLKVLIERNDFYSKECNSHLDDSKSCCRE
ncbi:uncharacterized protein LOC133788285 [Humulus lupulus]|uniref:uncharacterized protein LOC133788285 n=1 Tax=Humulus lupulus TaxID=3486 RepID=UPI002B40429C|nr:uncharacterized protein LOC133788285 [Humulus lupulus]